MSKSLYDEHMKKYVYLMKDVYDVSALQYERLKTYDTNIVQHKIPLKPNTNPFKQKLRHVNLILLPFIEKQVKNLLDAKVIVKLRFFDKIENLIPIRRNNGEIIFFVDFRNSNICSLKENYALTKMDHIL